jgi:hypothetical protein
VKIRCLSALASLLLVCVASAPALAIAGFHPYFRIDQGGSGFRMTDVNSNIETMKSQLQSAGAVTDIEKVGAGWGPSGSVGLWLLPVLRVGATYSYHRAVRDNRAEDVPSSYYLDDKLDMRVTEIGGEAAFRFQKLAGFTIGGHYAIAHATVAENLVEYDGPAYYELDGTAKKTKNTFGGYLGLEQTGDTGLVGYVHAGFDYRDMAHLPATWSESDGTTTTQYTGRTGWTDFSGFYVSVGVGFDVIH